MNSRALPVAAAVAALFALSALALPAAAQQPRGGFKPGMIAGHTGGQNPVSHPRGMAPLRGPTTYSAGRAMPRAGVDATVRNPVSGAQQAAVGHRIGFERPVNTPRVNPAEQPASGQPATTSAPKRGELLRRAEESAASAGDCQSRYQAEVQQIEADHQAGGKACFFPGNGTCHGANNAKKATRLQAANTQLYQCNRQSQAVGQGGTAQAQR